MPGTASLIRRFQIVAFGVALLVAFGGVDGQAATVTVPLNAKADLTSNFITNWSEGVAQLNRPWANTKRQPFWSTTDPDRTYNSSFDFFPNDNQMRFGELTYDDSSLTAGSGTAAITDLTLGIEKDPLDPSYVNGTWLSFTTDLTTYSGSVTVVAGTTTGINLTANYTSTGDFGATKINANGKFTVVGDRFQVMASGYNPALGNFNPSVAWNWTGKILDADFNGNGTVDASDYTVWRDNLNATGATPYTLGDANGDGDVNADDYQVWKSQFGGQTPAGFAAASANVPEPVGAVSAAMAAMSLCLCRGISTRVRRCI